MDGGAWWTTVASAYVMGFPDNSQEADRWQEKFDTAPAASAEGVIGLLGCAWEQRPHETRCKCVDVFMRRYFECACMAVGFFNCLKMACILRVRVVGFWLISRMNILDYICARLVVN